MSSTLERSDYRPLSSSSLTRSSYRRSCLRPSRFLVLLFFLCLWFYYLRSNSCSGDECESSYVVEEESVIEERPEIAIPSSGRQRMKESRPQLPFSAPKLEEETKENDEETEKLEDETDKAEQVSKEKSDKESIKLPENEIDKPKVEEKKEPGETVQPEKTSDTPKEDNPHATVKTQPVKIGGKGGEPGECIVPYQFDFEGPADVIVHEILQGAGRIEKHSDDTKHALLSMESSLNYPIQDDYKGNGYDYLINYRLDSDVPIPYTYTFFDLKRSPVPLEQKRTDAYIAAFISNCGGSNGRLHLLEELSKLIPIHSYGNCLNNRVLADEKLEHLSDLKNDLSPKTVIKNYYFTISFENSNTIDYVTEKYYQALEAGSIPIVLGAPNFEKEFMIRDKTSGSPGAVYVHEGESAETLAKRLQEIINSKALYAQYTAWKQNGWDAQFEKIVAMQRTSDMCRLAQLFRGVAKNEYKRPA